VKLKNKDRTEYGDVLFIEDLYVIIDDE